MSQSPPQDPTAESRKADHIELAFQSQVERAALDPRFDYEPLLAPHPAPGSLPCFDFGGKQMRAPLWVSSMTGGTEQALTINHNLARACQEFGLGMGLGSCRPLLIGMDRYRDFNIRPITGPDVPLYANLGVAQIENLLDKGEEAAIQQMISALDADGLIIHVNPLQEAMQPEGDVFRRSPLAVIEATLQALPQVPIIVKEVGQGMGPRSLAKLLALPLLAIDTAAGGGTNFSKLELFRSDDMRREAYAGLTRVGHAASEMVSTLNEIVERMPADEVRAQNLIISGGVRSFLDGYHLTQTARLPAIYGQASALLKVARGEYSILRTYIAGQIRGLELAQAYLYPR